MGSRRQRSIIDAIARVVSREHEILGQGMMADMLLIDVKGAFDHVSRGCLLQTMERIDANIDRILWI